jgi:hypothetical protein
VKDALNVAIQTQEVEECELMRSGGGLKADEWSASVVEDEEVAMRLWNVTPRNCQTFKPVAKWGSACL